MPVWRVNDVLVYLIRDDEAPGFGSQLSDQKKFIPGENLAGGVGRVADDDCFRFLRKRLAQLIRIKIESWRPERHIDRPRARQNRVCSVVLVEWGKNDDRIAGIASGHQCDEHGLS